ncbi:MAG: hypothetical protein ABI846_06495 [Rudaea sp.]
MSDDHNPYPTIGPEESCARTSWERAAAAGHTPAQPDWHRFIDWLSRLGPTLWLHRDGPDLVFPRARLLARGVLLLDHPALVAFGECATLTAHGAVAANGPREWLELRDAREQHLASLYLLPDSDYLA